MVDHGKKGRRKCLHHNGNYFCNLKDESCHGVCDDFIFKTEKMAEKKNKLILFWEAKAGDKIKAMRSSKSLQRQAEIDVAKAQEDFETAKDNFDKAKMDAKDNAKEGFQKIVKTHRAMIVEKKDFDNAIEIYEALFEEKPRLLE